jgi:uncharacterized protein (TIGR00299 family) protein
VRIAYFDCIGGISGDMAVAALLDAGVELDALDKELRKLALSNYALGASKTHKGTIAATSFEVRADPEQPSRNVEDITRMIETSRLSDRVKGDSLRVFAALAQAEAKVHGTKPEEVHFHEIGAVDSIVDIVGTCAALEFLKIDEVACSPLPMGSGFVECAHGKLPLPAPATAELVASAGVPVYSAGIQGETVTPTGAALVATLARRFGCVPSMTASGIGYGAGKADFDIPNLLRVIIGEGQSLAEAATQEVAVVETTIDDMNPQLYEPLMEKLFAAGALDVFLVPIHMKKNRPAVLLSAICPRDLANALAQVILEESSTLGVRTRLERRQCVPREIVEVETEFGPVKVKVSGLGHRRFSPEYDDCRRIAAEKSVPVRVVMDAALAAALGSERE